MPNNNSSKQLYKIAELEVKRFQTQENMFLVTIQLSSKFQYIANIISIPITSSEQVFVAIAGERFEVKQNHKKSRRFKIRELQPISLVSN